MERSAQSAVTVRLEDYEEGFLAELARLGYASRSREAQRGLARHLSRWLAMRGLALPELNEGVAGQYAAARREERSHLRSKRALGPLLDYLRGLGIVPAAEVAVPETAGEELLARFAAYLAGERCLAAATVSSYLFQVRPFVAAHADASRWSSLTARQVARFAAHSAAGLRPRSAQVRANALRAKGRKERISPLDPATTAALRLWQRENPGPASALVFTARGTTRKMTPDAVAQRLRVHAATAASGCPSIATKNLTPHVLRHTFAMRLQAAGIGGPAIALLLGHESPASTRPYLQADLELKQRALDRTAPPRTRRGRYTAKDELLAFLEAL